MKCHHTSGKQITISYSNEADSCTATCSLNKEKDLEVIIICLNLEL